MKKNILAIACFFSFTLALHAQPVLLGMTKQGGSAQTGTIISYTIALGNLLVLNSFEPVESSGRCRLMKAADGKIYGTSFYGRYGHGGIYSFDPATSSYTSLFDFNGLNGSSPTTVIQVNGLFYGTTTDGGSFKTVSQFGDGVLYSYNPQTDEYTKLVDFDGTNGSYPTGLVLASNGKLYGTTYNAGINNSGVIFSFDPATQVYERLMVFDGTNGKRPTGSLCQAANGLLYGMTQFGGQWNTGILYSFNPATNAFQKLADFGGTTGTTPTAYASLMEASDGKLYGMTYSGGSSNHGVIFSFDPATNDYKTVKDFNGADGSRPFCDLIQLSDGKLYGMTFSGSNSDYGTLFSMDPTTNSYQKLHDFDGITGGNPIGNLVQADNGKLYGAGNKNSNGYGNIFSFDPTISTMEVHKTFGYNDNGSFASAGFTKATNGKYYGMTIDGGTYGFGLIFTFDPGSQSFTKVHEFEGATGGKPYGQLVQAADGKLYGMTYSGGSSNHGVIFSFDPGNNTYTKLKDFDGTDGAYPYGSLLQADNGKLYGMTKNGGSSDMGVLFSYDPDSHTYLLLKNFSGTDGSNPYGNLIQAGNKRLYGMTNMGGSRNNGVIFSFNPVSNTYTKLKDFEGSNGANPTGSLVQASNGKLYGMTVRGGRTRVKGTFGNSISNYGIIFSFDPVTNSLTTLKEFDGTNGSNPNGTLMQASNGKLYGMTAAGGSQAKGVVFSFDLTGKTAYLKLRDFDGTNGANPSTGSQLTEIGNAPAPPVTTSTYISLGELSGKALAISTVKTIGNVVVYPNPFTNKSTIQFTAAETNKIDIELYDASGALVGKVFQGQAVSGQTYSIPVGEPKLPKGTYFYRIGNGQQEIIGRLIKH